ncbi:MAG: Uma2 family endonuclease [Bacteroidota bacterium]|nr:Uma2 family endonuclease [Bacteroidota bacterium]
MSALPNVYITEQDYLEMERISPFKNEYYRGQVYAMAGATYRHSKIISNLVGQIYPKIKNTGCNAFFSDLRIHVPNPPFYAYPDIVILCNKPQFSDDAADTIENPTVIIEVLSKSTENYDKSVKFGLYRFNRSFKEYILIHQDSPKIEIFKKIDDFNWAQGESSDINRTITIDTLNIEIGLRDIYEEIEFEN